MKIEADGNDVNPDDDEFLVCKKIGASFINVVYSSIHVTYPNLCFSFVGS